MRDLCLRVLDFECQETSGYLKHVTLEDLFPNQGLSEVVIHSPLETGAASLSFEEQVCVAAIIRLLSPKVIFEIGTFRGYTTRGMARNAPEDCQIYTLDLPPERFGESRLRQHAFDAENIRLNENHKPAIGDLYRRDEIARRKITQLYGSSDAFDYSDFKNRVDLFLIDGAHSYDFVRNDTERALECASLSGVIVWHDLKGGFRGLVSYMRELASRQVLYHLKGTSLVVCWPKGRGPDRQIARGPDIS